MCENVGKSCIKIEWNGVCVCSSKKTRICEKNNEINAVHPKNTSYETIQSS